MSENNWIYQQAHQIIEEYQQIDPTLRDYIEGQADNEQN